MVIVQTLIKTRNGLLWIDHHHEHQLRIWLFIEGKVKVKKWKLKKSKDKVVFHKNFSIFSFLSFFNHKFACRINKIKLAFFADFECRYEQQNIMNAAKTHFYYSFIHSLIHSFLLWTFYQDLKCELKSFSLVRKKVKKKRNLWWNAP